MGVCVYSVPLRHQHFLRMSLSVQDPWLAKREYVLPVELSRDLVDVLVAPHAFESGLQIKRFDFEIAEGDPVACPLPYPRKLGLGVMRVSAARTGKEVFTTPGSSFG